MFFDSQGTAGHSRCLAGDCSTKTTRMRGSQFKQLSIGVDRMLTDAKAMSEDGGIKWD